jgi:hypothetical protein
MKPLWILVYVYMGHPGHLDGWRQADPAGYAFSQEECEREAVLRTAMLRGANPPNGPPREMRHDYYACEKIK